MVCRLTVVRKVVKALVMLRVEAGRVHTAEEDPRLGLPAGTQLLPLSGAAEYDQV